ncbi:uncharacterized protein LOC141655128 [Silene latifolia]|uniref:uncharacterized protein LOC141655128 n=1 Tax=Silene latifolia TaxID=37657 RepID=UPI003D7716BB
MEKKSTNYNDDEPVTVPSAAPTSDYPGFGKIGLNLYNKADAPLEKTDYRLVVELLGSDTGDQRDGVDIVAVLDVSYCMGGKKLEKLKTSMKFLLKKLDPIDRLSIVTFSSDATRLCPLTGMNKNGQDKIEKLINQLDVDGYTNISAGLQTALSVLAQRRQRDGRITGIMLVSHGKLTAGCVHPSTVDVSSVPVYTFGLGNDHDSQLLQEIASKSNKGSYSIVDVEGSNSASLNIAFSTCLAGLLSVVVQDLELTLKQKESELQEVRAGNYDQSCAAESVKISFGLLYNREKRTTTVFLSLPAVQDQMSVDILIVSYTYRPIVGGRLYKSPPIKVKVARTSSPMTVDPVQVCNEIVRGDIAAAMRTAGEQADANDFDGAKKTLHNAEKSLDKLNPEADELIKALKYEVREFLRFLKDRETYHREGRVFPLSSKLAHNLQRFAARGDSTELLELDVPVVVPFDNQNINIKVPSAYEDKEAANNNNNAIVAQLDTLNQHLSQVVITLKAIQDSIVALKSV